MDKVTLREYLPGDWQAMHALDLVCFEPVFQFSRGAMHRFAEAPGAIVVLAEATAELVGFCVVNMEQQTGYVVTLDVAPPWRRRGLARRLMAEAETRLRATGGTSMALHVSTANSAAMQFYESIGYGRVGMAKGFYGRGLDALVYRKRLEALG
jgi:ribosomal-protein-alanine N-acetyltransferase